MSPFRGLGGAGSFCVLHALFRVYAEDQPGGDVVAIRQLHDYVRDFPGIAFRTPFEAAQYLRERTDRGLILRQQLRRILTGAPSPAWAISRTAARRMAVRFLGLFIRAIARPSPE